MQLYAVNHGSTSFRQTHAGSRRRMQCSGAAVKRSSVTTTQCDRSSEQGSRFAAALSAVVIASTVFSPVAFAEAEESKLATQVAEAAESFKTPQKSKLSAVDEAFQNSPTLKALLEKSEANKAKNKREIQNKYCYRQAELGIGDCGGLRYIPGMTKSGKQKTPEWLQKVLGVEGKIPKMEGEGKTIEQLLGPNPDN